MPAKRLQVLMLLIMLAIVCSLTSTSLTPAAATSQYGSYKLLMQSMLDQVSQASIRSYMADLSGDQEVKINGQPYTLETRHALSGEPAAKAAQYLFEFYNNLGLNVYQHLFPFRGQTLSNIVAQKEGSIFPERIYLITSHYDDVPILGPAPGADDNASGTTAVMVAAEILSQYDFGCTLRYVNFGAEEYGMIGSQHYAQDAYCSGEDIRGVINLDMIAWNTPGSTKEMDLHAASSIPGSEDLASAFQDVVSDFNLDLVPEMANPVTSRSDHASFWNYNYPAILVSEDFEDFNPNYHSVDDDLDSLQDFNYFTEMVKASIGTLANIGCLVEDGWGTLSGKVVSSETLAPLPGVSIALHNPQWGNTWYTRSDASGFYQFSAPAGWHKLSVDGIGYARQEREVSIIQNQTQDEDFTILAADEEALFFPLSTNSHPFIPQGCP